MASAADARTPSLRVGAGDSFDCENVGLSQHPTGKGEPGQFKKYSAFVAVTMAFGAFCGLAGFFASGPLVTTHVSAKHGVVCDASIMPKVKALLRDLNTKALEKGTLSPMKSLGKFAAVALPHRVQPPKLRTRMIARAVVRACATDDLSSEDQQRVAELEAELKRLKQEEDEALSRYMPMPADDGGDEDAELSRIMAELAADDDDELFMNDDRTLDDPVGEPSSTRTTAVKKRDAPAPPPNDVPRSATIVVAGGGTALGEQLLRALVAASKDFKLRALESGGVRVDTALQDMLDTKSGSSDSRTQIENALDGAAAFIIISASAGGKGGVESDKVKSLLSAIPKGSSLRRVVFVSSHGVERTSELPFSLQNVWGGPLDKLRGAEEEVILRAKDSIPSFSIVHVGKLSGGGAGSGGGDQSALSRRCEIAAGDALQGELPAATVSTVLLESLTRVEAVNASFSVAPLSASSMMVGAEVADAIHWDDEFLKLQGPEIYRRALQGCEKARSDELVGRLREWALGFVRPGSGLTTPVELDDLTDDEGVVTGVVLRFVQKPLSEGYLEFDEKETKDQKWQRATASTKQSTSDPDGALYVIAEVAPYPRVRVVRAELEEGMIVKVMSEATILESLDQTVKIIRAR